ncbi:MAG: hypothetical protein ACXVCY_13175 [Pseudobdellovibrionaceae bacterium]
MKLLKTFTILYFLQSFASIAFASTNMNCSSQTGKMDTQFIFSFSPINLMIRTSFDGSPLPPYIFLNDKIACGEPLNAQDNCVVQESKDIAQQGDYYFKFSCTDGRHGELHYENGSAMAYCYRNNAPMNQKSGRGCSIYF